ncbi:MAG: hypothetical protein RI907_620 [Pseudomonadota bacterium]|jgi:hypothetical protein
MKNQGYPSLVDASRREFLVRAESVVASFVALGSAAVLSPRMARAAGHPLAILSPDEAATLEALGNMLMPGAAEAGIAHFVDAQLGADAPLLMLRYLDFPMPLADFYRQGLAALDAAARHAGGSALPGLAAAQRKALVAQLASGAVEGWSGPPAPLFYFTLRADAVDVCCGTEDGFARLGIPYLAHIAPHSSW